MCHLGIVPSSTQKRHPPFIPTVSLTGLHVELFPPSVHFFHRQQSQNNFLISPGIAPRQAADESPLKYSPKDRQVQRHLLQLSHENRAIHRNGQHQPWWIQVRLGPVFKANTLSSGIALTQMLCRGQWPLMMEVASPWAFIQTDTTQFLHRFKMKCNSVWTEALRGKNPTPVKANGNFSSGFHGIQIWQAMNADLSHFFLFLHQVTAFFSLGISLVNSHLTKYLSEVPQWGWDISCGYRIRFDVLISERHSP